MGFSLDVSVPMIVVFFQGLLSFFSPCVFPLIPIYIGYLSGGTGVKGEDGKMYYKRSKVLWNTCFFVLGISCTFFILGLGATAAGTFFKSNQAIFARVGGILIFLFGLYQLGIFGKLKVFGKERRLPLQINKFAMSPWTAFAMGFLFSFAWTPCVGPVLASVLMMTASASSRATGFFMIGVYALGFVLPFLAVGFFTTTLLSFFKKHRNIVKYTVQIGGVLMIAMGLMMFTGTMNRVTGYLSNLGQENVVSQENATQKEEETDAADDAKEESKDETTPAIDFQLQDQYGNVHKLSDYRGKTVFLNFWATWCGPCRNEMPDIQNLYEKYDTEGEDALVVLGVASPDFGREASEEEIAAFLKENGYTYPTLMDKEGKITAMYGVNSYPTTFMIDRDGNVFGYVTGMLSEDIMENIIQQTMTGKRQ